MQLRACVGMASLSTQDHTAPGIPDTDEVGQPEQAEQIVRGLEHATMHEPTKGRECEMQSRACAIQACAT
jgi:hypothetical protein